MIDVLDYRLAVGCDVICPASMNSVIVVSAMFYLMTRLMVVQSTREHDSWMTVENVCEIIFYVLLFRDFFPIFFLT